MVEAEQDPAKANPLEYAKNWVITILHKTLLKSVVLKYYKN